MRTVSFICCLGFFFFTAFLITETIFKLWEVFLLAEDFTEFFLFFWLGLFLLFFSWSFSLTSFFSWLIVLWCFLISRISSLISSETSIIIRWSIVIIIMIILLPIFLSLILWINLLSNLQFCSINGSTCSIISTILSFFRLNEFILSFHLSFVFFFKFDFVWISDEFELSYSLLYLAPIDKTFSELIYFFNGFIKIFWRYWCT